VPNSATTIDLIVTSMADHHNASGIHKIGLSDHFLCYTCIDISKPKVPHKMVRFRSYKYFDQNFFLKQLRENTDLSHITQENDVHVAWAKWKDTFAKICDYHAPLKESRVKNRHNPWMTP
jgi:hypothetical protein